MSTIISPTNNTKKENIMKNALMKFRNNLDASRRDESGDIVQTILIIVIFVVIVAVVGGILYTNIKGAADNTGKCINSIGSTISKPAAAKC